MGAQNLCLIRNFIPPLLSFLEFILIIFYSSVNCFSSTVFEIIFYLISHGAASVPVFVVSDILRRLMLNETTGQRPKLGASLTFFE